MENTAQVLNREWYIKLQQQSAANFINLPIEFQLRNYDYNMISEHYLNFFQGENTRGEKLSLARKFLKFIRNINKNRAKQELGESFFECFEYFMENFKELLGKPDLVHLETLDVISQAIDKSQFIEDIINIEELQRRVKNLETIQENEKVIEGDWKEFNEEYKLLNHENLQIRDKFILEKNKTNDDNLIDIPQLNMAQENV